MSTWNNDESEMIAALALPHTNPPHALLIEPVVRRALEEDLGRAGDITTDLTVPSEKTAKAVIAARKEGRVAGLIAAELAFRLVDGRTRFDVEIPDGADAPAGGVIARVAGPARALLAAERVALNFLGHLSGVATATRALVRAVEGTKARITCTRKTTPGLRALEKYAVRCGGGTNHRFGLDDAVLIKDNHVAAAGSVRAAVTAARAGAGHLVKIEVEVDSLAQLEEALAAGADAIMLDNFGLGDLKRAVARAKGSALLEASGGVTLETVRAIAETGVDVISSGAITHSAPALDVGLDFIGS